MDTKTLIELLGGPSAVMSDTGLSKGRISQWVTANKIPRPWLKFYLLKRPDIPWADYKGEEPVPLDVEANAPAKPSLSAASQAALDEERRQGDRRAQEDRRAIERRAAERRAQEQGAV